jgi:hypothetical protein
MADTVKDSSPLTKNLSIFNTKMFYSAHGLGPRSEKTYSGIRILGSKKRQIQDPQRFLSIAMDVQHK